MNASAPANSKDTSAGSRPARSPGWLAVAIGLGLGMLVGGDVVGWLIGLWRDFMLPAFMEVNSAGIPLCA